ncbi:hypothetical protein [Edaphobacter bradus]|uniref:hypothetical protein n=1 Tax=Edaphobacter bradus TaxID=2259016 RepID=UPI0021E00C10|nr:hypothetical protein [Edaphobacter bradus]
MDQPNKQQPPSKQGMPSNPQRSQSGQQQTQQGSKPDSGSYNAPSQRSDQSGQAAPSDKR